MDPALGTITAKSHDRFGVMAAAGTPQAAIARISQEIAEVVKHPEVVKNFQTAVIDPIGLGPQAYGQVIARENEAMARAATARRLTAGRRCA